MEILRPPARLAPGTAACIGAFDGLHLGHQALLQRGLELAPRIAVVTFEPRPAEVLAPPEHLPPRLLLPSDRERVCEQLGCDHLALLPFDRQIAAMSPEAWVQDYLIEGLRPSAVVVGEDFRFGAKRKGDTSLLRSLLASASIELSVVSHLCDLSGSKLGTTTIRRQIQTGAMKEAAEGLGRWYALQGEVVHGDARGRTLGFPTANIELSHAPLLPPQGTYATFLHAPGFSGGLSSEPQEDAYWPAVANLGRAPTFDPTGARSNRLEVHALDLDLGQSLYGREVEVFFVHRLRDEQKFPSVDALRTAIEGDIEAARPYLEDRHRSRCHILPLSRSSASSLTHAPSQEASDGQ